MISLNFLQVTSSSIKLKFMKKIFALWLCLICLSLTSLGFAQWNTEAPYDSWPASNSVFLLPTMVNSFVSLVSSSSVCNYGDTSWDFFYKSYSNKIAQLFVPTSGVWDEYLWRTNIYVKSTLPPLPPNTSTDFYSYGTTGYTNTVGTTNYISLAYCDYAQFVSNTVVNIIKYHSIVSELLPDSSHKKPWVVLTDPNTHTNFTYSFIATPSCFPTNVAQNIWIQYDYFTIVDGITTNYYSISTNSNLNTYDIWTYNTTLAADERNVSWTYGDSIYGTFLQNTHTTVKANLPIIKNWILNIATNWTVGSLADTNGYFTDWLQNTILTNWTWKAQNGQYLCSNVTWSGGTPGQGIATCTAPYNGTNHWEQTVSHPLMPLTYEELIYNGKTDVTYAFNKYVKKYTQNTIPNGTYYIAYGETPSKKQALLEANNLPRQYVDFIVTNWDNSRSGWQVGNIYINTTNISTSFLTTNSILIESSTYFDYTPDLHFADFGNSTNNLQLGLGHIVTNSWKMGKELKNGWLEFPTVYTWYSNYSTGWEVGPPQQANCIAFTLWEKNIGGVITFDNINNALNTMNYYNSVSWYGYTDWTIVSGNSLYSHLPNDSMGGFDPTVIQTNSIIPQGNTRYAVIVPCYSNGWNIAQEKGYFEDTTLFYTLSIGSFTNYTKDLFYTYPSGSNSIRITNSVIITNTTSVLFKLYQCGYVTNGSPKNFYGWYWDLPAPIMSGGGSPSYWEPKTTNLLYSYTITPTNPAIAIAVTTNWNVAAGYHEIDYDFDGVKTALMNMNSIRVPNGSISPYGIQAGPQFWDADWQYRGYKNTNDVWVHDFSDTNLFLTMATTNNVDTNSIANAASLFFMSKLDSYNPSGAPYPPHSHDSWQYNYSPAGGSYFAVPGLGGWGYYPSWNGYYDSANLYIDVDDYDLVGTWTYNDACGNIQPGSGQTIHYTFWHSVGNPPNIPNYTWDYGLVTAWCDTGGGTGYWNTFEAYHYWTYVWSNHVHSVKHVSSTDGQVYWGTGMPSTNDITMKTPVRGSMGQTSMGANYVDIATNFNASKDWYVWGAQVGSPSVDGYGLPVQISTQNIAKVSQNVVVGTSSSEYNVSHQAAAAGLRPYTFHSAFGNLSWMLNLDGNFFYFTVENPGGNYVTSTPVTNYQAATTFYWDKTIWDSNVADPNLWDSSNRVAKATRINSTVDKLPSTYYNSYLTSNIVETLPSVPDGLNRVWGLSPPYLIINFKQTGGFNY